MLLHLETVSSKGSLRRDKVIWEDPNPLGPVSLHTQETM